MPAPTAHQPDGIKGRAFLHLLILLLFLTFLGCAVINRFVFTPTRGITATPAASNIPFEDVWFKSADGTDLNGWFINGAPWNPLVVYFHGNGGNLTDNLGYIKLLHARGYPIFIFDYRGYGRSKGKPLGEEGLYQDARGALAYLSARGWRQERMIYFGQSLGAAVALQSALELPPAGLVMEGSFTNMNEIVKYTSAFGYYAVGWWGIDMPFDNLAKIPSLKVPLLMIHGERDLVAPLEMTVRLYQRAPDPKKLYIIPRGGHCNAFMFDSTPYLAAWRDYIHSLTVKTASAAPVTP
jgi:uncharacterized protein